MSGLFLPSGSGDFPEELQRRLQQGDPDTGWLGDENMYIRKCGGDVCKRRQCAGYVVCRMERSGRPTFIAHNPSTQLNGPKLLRHLAEGDPRTVDVNKMIDNVIKENDKLEAERNRRAVEAAEEAADRMYVALRKQV
jgi:hypothetical protein